MNDDVTTPRADPAEARTAGGTKTGRTEARNDPAQKAHTQAKGPRLGPVAHTVALVRTVIYSVTATAFFIGTTLLCLWVAFFPPDKTRWLFKWWASADLFLLRLLCGQHYEVRGKHNIPHGPALVASKHQSAWETISLIPILPRTSIVLKQELLRIPIWGWYARFYGMISIDRSAGAAALKLLAKDAQRVTGKGMQLLIFPEGTRTAVGAAPDYKPGAAYLYDKLQIPLVPVAHNSGLFWPHGRFVRYPGMITIEFMEAIPAGLPRKVANERMIDAIETASTRLAQDVVQARSARSAAAKV